jgi:DtxR family Mn-dependent transcriptional regulator
MSVTRSGQDYLKAIYKLQGGGRPVATSALADQLGVAAPSATNMVGKLAEAGLLTHTPYRGVELTPAGAAVALEVIRHHRLWELFLHRALGLPLDQVHEEAERLEHELSESLEEHMTRLLGDPTVDPHGDPIPARDGQVDAVVWPTLAELPIGRSGTVRRVPDSDAEMLRYLQSLGLVPGAAVEVAGREPFDGPVTVRVDGTARVLGTGLARCVFVEPML